MISAWDVYWVMQLDSIGFVVAAIAGVTFVASLIGFAFGYMETSSSHICPELEVSKRERERGARLTSFSRRYFPWSLAMCLVAALIPSTKTAAAMIVLPAIANNETLHREAGELYGIAKQALKDAVGGEKKAD